MQAPFSLPNIPNKPGCYLYKDKKGEVIYIGKAKDLRKRVSSYFTKTQDDAKTEQLVKNIADIETIITKTEAQALLLEANLIRQRQPKYNIDLKGGKRYAYVLLTDEKYPRLLTAREQSIKGEYFGPFVRAQLRHALINTLRKAFFIRTCRVLPKKTCLRYHIGLCKAPCTQYQSEEEYAENIAKVREFLQGKNKGLIRELEKRMKEFSTRSEFEHAKEIRDQIQALDYLQERQVIEREEYIHEDVINIIKFDSKVRIGVFSVRNGVLGDKEEFVVDEKEGYFDEFLRRFYEYQGKEIPKLILVPFAVEQSTEKYLSKRAGHSVELKVPVRGARKDLLELVAKNIEAGIEGPGKVALDLKEKLKLPALPRTIECFDISHLQGSHMVGSMSRFVDGKPEKKGYRKFKINTVEGIDDFRAMQEVVRRRYRRVLSEGLALPDLVVVDGGAEQLAFAIKGLEEAGAEMPIVGLAKRDEEIYFPRRRRAVKFPKSSDAMKTLIAIRDEAHRFGVAYHRLLRSKAHKK